LYETSADGTNAGSIQVKSLGTPATIGPNNYNLALQPQGGNVGIGDTTPVSLLTVGSGDLFQVDSFGNLIKIRGVTYSWPAAQGGANTFLQNNGSGTLSWAAAGGTGTITSISQSTGITATPNPITTIGTIGLTNPIKSCAAGTAIQSFDLGLAAAPTCVPVGGGPGGVPGDEDSAVQFNRAGAFGGDNTAFSWDYNNKILTINSSSDESLTIRKNDYFFFVGANRSGGDYVDIGAYHGGAAPGWKNLILNRGGGNVGIGTVSPDAKLDVSGYLIFDTANFTSFKRSNGNVNAKGILLDGTLGLQEIEWLTSLFGNGYGFREYGTDTGAGTQLRIAGRNNSASFTDILTIKDTGNVGIGTINPVDKLHIAGGGRLRLGKTDAVNEGGEMIFEGTGANTDWIMDVYTNRLRVFDGAAGTERFVIRSDGNVGIGATNPGARLHVAGNVKIDSANTLEFGAGVAGKEASAGKIGYQTWSAAPNGALDIVGAGASVGTRKVKLWDNVEIPGDLTVTGKNNSSSAYFSHGFSVKMTSVTGPTFMADNQFHTALCPPGYALFGTGAYATNAFDGSLTAYCIDASDFLDMTDTKWWGAPSGGNCKLGDPSCFTPLGLCKDEGRCHADDAAYYVDCQAGYVATGIQVYSSTCFDWNLELKCTKLKTGLSRNDISFAFHSNVDANNNADNVFHHAECPTGSVIASVAVWATTCFDSGLQIGCTNIIW
jgi:hypothetical protein